MNPTAQYTRRFESLAQFAQAVRPLLAHGTAPKPGTAADYLWSDDDNFRGALKGHALLDALQGAGDPATSARVGCLYDAMRDALPPTSTPSFAPCVTGGRVDVPAYLSYEPECFWTRAEDQRDTAPIRLAVSLSRAATVSAETIEMYGAAIAAAAIAASASRPVTIVAATALLDDNSSRLALVSVEIDMRSADLGTVALLLANPAPYRRVMFALLCDMWKTGAQTFIPPSNQADLIRALGGIYLPRLNGDENGRTQDGWIKWARDLLARMTDESAAVA